MSHLPPRNSTRVHSFDPGSFVSSLLPQVIQSQSIHVCSFTQVSYLSEYLRDIGTRTLVIEDHYIDRHYMDEFQQYYATCLNEYGHVCKRIHAFKPIFSESQFNKALSNPKGIWSRRLQQRGEYLGFIVLRPIQEALIGRTFLVTLPSKGCSSDPTTRHFEATFEHNVHLLGLNLKLTGLPFQQQDQRVSACASTAIWVSLSKAIRTDGGRPPTPSKITDAAVKSVIHTRPYPQSGLADYQICEAFRAFGFGPDLMNVWSIEHTLFKAILGLYIKSGIPVLCAIKPLESLEGHAIAVCGNKMDPEFDDCVQWNGNSSSFRTPLTQWNMFYFHDDRLGPYAKGLIRSTGMPLIDASTNDKKPQTQLSIPIPNRPDEESHLLYIVSPLYPKLRTSAQDILHYGTRWLYLINQTLGLDYSELTLDAYFRRSGDVLSEIRNLSNIKKDKARFLKSIALSRYVAIVAIDLNNQPLLRIYLDATDRLQPLQNSPPTIGLLPIPHQDSISGIIISVGSQAQQLVSALKEKGILVAHR